MLSLKAPTTFPLPGCSLQLFLPFLLPGSSMLLCSREEMFKASPASQQAPPAVPPTGPVRSQARPNRTSRRCQFPLPQRSNPEHIPEIQTSRNKYSVLNVFPQLAANPTNHRLTCTRRWEPPAGSGSLARSPPPRRHRRARPRTHRGLRGKPHQNQTPVNFGRALWRTTVSCQPSLKVK